MAMHNGSTALAHQLDRFSITDFEDIYGEAARLKVQPSTLTMYRDWYGEQTVLVSARGLLQQVPAYELEIRRQVWGEKLKQVSQLELPL